MASNEEKRDAFSVSMDPAVRDKMTKLGQDHFRGSRSAAVEVACKFFLSHPKGAPQLDAWGEADGQE